MRNASMLLGALVLFCISCGGEAERGESERSDLQALLLVVAEDEALDSLEEADRALASDLPVRAGDLLEAGALPAIDRHLERVRAVSVSTELGRGFKGELAASIENRRSSVAGFRTVLARGLVEDFEFVQASAAMRTADEAYYSLIERIQHRRDGEEEPEEEAESPQ